MSINSVCISGNVGRDPELRMTASQMQVCTFSVCVNDRRKNGQTGEWEDVPNWVDVTFFGNRGEAISNHVSKGTHVTIQGRLHENKWQNKDGQNRRKLEVIGEEIDWVSSGQKQQQAQQPDYQAQQPMEEETGVYDDDIPF